MGDNESTRLAFLRTDSSKPYDPPITKATDRVLAIMSFLNCSAKTSEPMVFPRSSNTMQ